jgi:hypothetical protein
MSTAYTMPMSMSMSMSMSMQHGTHLAADGSPGLPRARISHLSPIYLLPGGRESRPRG